MSEEQKKRKGGKGGKEKVETSYNRKIKSIKLKVENERKKRLLKREKKVFLWFLLFGPTFGVPSLYCSFLGRLLSTHRWSGEGRWTNSEVDNLTSAVDVHRRKRWDPSVLVHMVETQDFGWTKIFVLKSWVRWLRNFTVCKRTKPSVTDCRRFLKEDLNQRVLLGR